VLYKDIVKKDLKSESKSCVKTDLKIKSIVLQTILNQNNFSSDLKSSKSLSK